MTTIFLESLALEITNTLNILVVQKMYSVNLSVSNVKLVFIELFN